MVLCCSGEFVLFKAMMSWRCCVEVVVCLVVLIGDVVAVVVVVLCLVLR